MTEWCPFGSSIPNTLSVKWKILEPKTQRTLAGCAYHLCCVCLFLFVLSAWPKLSSSQKRDSQLRKLASRQVCWTLSWLMVGAGESILLWDVPLWAGGPGCMRNQAADRATEDKTVSRPLPWPLLLFLPWLTSLQDRVWLGHVSCDHPFCSRLLLVLIVAQQQKAPWAGTLSQLFPGVRLTYLWLMLGGILRVSSPSGQHRKGKPWRRSGNLKTQMSWPLRLGHEYCWWHNYVITLHHHITSSHYVITLCHYLCRLWKYCRSNREVLHKSLNFTRSKPVQGVFLNLFLKIRFIYSILCEYVACIDAWVPRGCLMPWEVRREFYCPLTGFRGGCKLPCVFWDDCEPSRACWDLKSWPLLQWV